MDLLLQRHGAHNPASPWETTMKCSRVQLAIDEIGDLDRLPVDIARHVDRCDDCQRFGAELLALRSLLREPDRISPPEDFDQKLAARLAGRTLDRPSGFVRFWNIGPKPAFASAVALVILGVGTLSVARLVSEPEPASTARNAAVAMANEAGSSPTSTTGVISEPTLAVDPAPPGIVHTAYTPGHSAPSHARKPVARDRGTADTMVFVRDELGARVVNVPAVLVGSENILPLSDSNQPQPTGEALSF